VGKDGGAKYSEEDVKTAARVLTGWKIDTAFNAVFDSTRHDTANKSFSPYYSSKIIIILVFLLLLYLFVFIRPSYGSKLSVCLFSCFHNFPQQEILELVTLFTILALHGGDEEGHPLQQMARSFVSIRTGGNFLILVFHLAKYNP
jgi:hypothetical protein